MTSSNYLGCLVFLGALGGASAHSYLFEPPSRNYVAQKAGKEDCAHCLQANGIPAVMKRGKKIWPSIKDPTSHGLCGDPVQHTEATPGDPMKPLKEQKYMKAEFANAPQRTYKAGDLVTFKVAVSAHHEGHYEFRICDRNMNADTIASATEGQECLNKVLLKKAPRNAQHCGNDYTGDCQRDNPKHPERWYVPPPGTKYTARGDSANWDDAEGAKPIKDISWEQFSGHADVHTMTYVIPEDLQCTHCTLQWYLSTGWVCAYDEDYFDHDPGFKFWGHYKQGRWDGWLCNSKQFPEEFWNCADIAVIGKNGGPTPPAYPTPPAPVLPAPVPAPRPTPTPPGKKPEPEPEPEGNKTEPEPEPEGNKTKAEPEPEPEGNKTKPEPEPESEPEPIPASSKKLYNQVDGNNDGVLTPAEFAFWSQARGVVAKACQDDADFKDPLGYSCADWDGYCFTKLLDYASDYTPQDILSIIYNCPKTCDESCKEGALLESNLHDGHRVGLVRRAEF